MGQAESFFLGKKSTDKMTPQQVIRRYQGAQ